MAESPANPPNAGQPDGFEKLEQLINTNHDELQESFKLLQAQITNLACKMNNQEVFRRGVFQVPFRPLVKHVKGKGDGLPKLPGPRHVIRIEPPDIVFAVGDAIPHPYFPKDHDELCTMTDSDLNTLSVLYNHNFGILETDDLTTRLNKFERYIS